MCCNRFDRRHFLGLTAGAIAGAGLASPLILRADEKSAWASDEWDPRRPLVATGKALRVQPILMYSTSQKREATSWKSWGGIQTEQAASEEVERIANELTSLCANADFPVETLPIVKVKSVEDAARARQADCDVFVVYPATGGGRVLRACISGEGDTVIFVRHRSGPVYYWYEALSVQYLSTGDDKPGDESPAGSRGVSVHDVVVDDYQDLLWRLRALYGVKNFVGARIVALGGPMGKYAPSAPEDARKRHGIEIIEVSYDDVKPRIKAALENDSLVSQAEKWTEQYLALPNTTLMTDKKFVVNCFLLYGVFKSLMREHDAPAFTIKNCMSTIMPMSKTTACLTLSLLNDEGLLAFCESDFVIIPAGILLHYISGKPVFLHNSTFPHKGIVTCAHCTAPRRMDGDRYEPAKIMTHYESEYGAAPKVEIPVGQEVTFIDPEYSVGRWVGFKGTVESNPFYEICRSQQDVRIQGDWKKLRNEVRDSHWMMVYGDYLREIGYATRRIGIKWETVSEA